jgi:uncharacterized protein (DUF924 family)
MSAHPIIEFWFGTPKDGRVDPDIAKRWFRKSADFDSECRERFKADLEAAKRGDLDSLRATSEGRLALILLFDQMSRNIYRDTPRAFEADPRAVEECLAMLDDGSYLSLPVYQRSFVLMPLMHAEDRELQAQSVERFRELAGDGGSSDSVSFAVRHREIVDRFGRFPHRNKILGRESTEEEIEFLKQPGSSF